MRNDALVTGLFLVHGTHLVDPAEVRDPGQQHCQENDDHGERALRALGARLGERGHAVADGLHAGHRGAAARKSAQKQPDADSLQGMRQRWGSLKRHRMPGVSAGLEHPVPEHREETRREEIGRQAEKDAGFPRSPQIHEGEHRQRSQAKHEGVRMQLRDRGHQRADSGRDPHGDIEDVIEHESGGGQQPNSGSEVLSRDRVRAAAVRIGRDGLPIGEIEDAQQQEDHQADRADIGQPDGSERKEDRQGGFRPVRRGTQGIQPERRHTRKHADPVLRFFGVGEVATQDSV